MPNNVLYNNYNQDEHDLSKIKFSIGVTGQTTPNHFNNASISQFNNDCTDN